MNRLASVQMKDFNDELARSYLDHLRNANEIIATLKDTANCPSSVPPKDEEEYKLTGRRSNAIGALEKAMKLVDKTFGVLHRGVQNLDCKLTNQVIILSILLTAIPFIQAISIAPLQSHYYSEALPTQHGYCAGISRRSATGNCE